MRCLFIVLAFIASSSISAGGDPSAENDSYWLGINSTIVEVPVADLERTKNNRFVFMEVSTVENPHVLPLAFLVSFSENDKTTNLGGFALYPGDNPGKFIVPTQKIIEKSGIIRIELILSSGHKGAEAVRVEIKSLKLIDTLPE